jgi:restriction system protein
MAMDSVPSYDSLLWPTLLALRETGGSASNDELLAKVTEIASVPDEIASIIHVDNRQTKLNYNLAWAKTYLKKVGALTNSARGIWALTEIGEHLDETATAAIPAQVRRENYDKRRSGPPVAGSETANSDFLEDDIPALDWKAQLLGTLQTIDPSAFERLSQRLLRESGFTKVEVTGRVGDGGIDGVGVLRLNLLSFSTLFQCKRYIGTVGAGAVRDFRGAMVGRSDKGLIITTGTFSADARREATRDGAPTIDLIDGDQLCNLLQSLKLGVSTRLVEHMTVDHDWFRQI